MKYQSSANYRTRLTTVSYREAQIFASRLEENRRTRLCLIEGRPLNGPWCVLHKGGYDSDKRLVLSIALNQYVSLRSIKMGFVRL